MVRTKDEAAGICHICRNTIPKVSPIEYEEENVIVRVFFHGDLVRPQVCPEEYTVIVVEGFV